MGAIERQEQAIVTPADADSVLEMIQAFEYFKSKVLNKKDFAVIQGEPRVKKSGWSKYALACNVSTELRDERVEERDGHRIYHFNYRAVHLPSGRFADAVGSASEAERREWTHPEHDVRSLAQTRAFNRSVSNLVGGGEVSAEEMEASEAQGLRKHVRSEQEERIREQARRDREERLAREEEPPPERVGPVEGMPPESLDELKEWLGNYIIDLDGTLVLSEYEDYFRVGRRRLLKDDESEMIDGWISQMGGAWDRESNCWRVPKEEAEGDAAEKAW